MTLQKKSVATLLAILSGGVSTASAQDVSIEVVPVLVSHTPLLQTTIADRGAPPPRAISVASNPDASPSVDPHPVIESSLAIQLSDGRISHAIKRYAEANGWQLAWEIERDFPIEYPATFTGDFLGIIEQMVLSLQNSDAPIRVKVYEANRVLRVVHATQ